MAKEKDTMLDLLIDGKTYQYPKGTLISEIAADHQSRYENDIVLVTASSYLRELHHRVHRNGELRFITTA
ncbi:MAG: nucleoside kinase, partial [Firmicutes bacterium]|nr:nucleoside kinase [Bacillota bacterium]